MNLLTDVNTTLESAKKKELIKDQRTIKRKIKNVDKIRTIKNGFKKVTKCNEKT